MRDDSYLRDKLEQIWQRYFSDVSRPNKIKIKFGRKARKRLGSIGQQVSKNAEVHFDTQIRINGHFKSPEIPEFVIDATIAHELCHYTHGFGSPLPKYFDHPHKGGVVEIELKKRGLKELETKEWRWLQENWKNHLAKLQ